MKEIAGKLNAEKMAFGIAISRFNSLFTGQLLKGAMDCIERHGGDAASVTVAWVPGANELPLAVQRLARSQQFDAVIALGCVVQGATPHAELINAQVARALAKVSMECDIPVINSVIAAQNLEQAVERSGTKAGNKGWDGALAAIEMASLLRQLT
ncbi:MAG: 6,7-dimethyl-8-ribityllumazine synthase [Kiritimatiellaeota bacterium]|nr:6,7-dimethyl-8-ribityllumazine synthase [Kiritimatiellota bacterium]